MIEQAAGGEAQHHPAAGRQCAGGQTLRQNLQAELQVGRLGRLRQALDPGEAEVVALALEPGTKDVVLDDLDARCFARRSGLQPIGTLGLLLAARRAGIIQAVSPEIEAPRKAGFHASDALIQRILAEAEEQ